ncbi:MAG: hypothetical protein IPH06_10565 [Alphaproteobacteria bacterium]|nr:hypothetical protein [Alphaproteobacteria bacterium]QQS58427.1 MAG: hypothetical protein IPN28_06320 [Alphaproteobacteria bacterium]
MRDKQDDDIAAAVQEVAQNIRTLAREVEQGRTAPVDGFEYVNDFTYDVLISTLAKARLATPEDAGRAPTEDLRQNANPLLAPIGFTIDEVYDDARKGRLFVLKSAWDEMKAHPDFPKDASALYDSLHYSFEFLGLTPGSEQALSALGATKEEFQKIDKSYALAAAYDCFKDHHVVAQFLHQPLLQRRQDKALSPSFDAAVEYVERYMRGMPQVINDINRIMKQSGLNDQETQFYFATRMEMEGYNPDGPPAPVQ